MKERIYCRTNEERDNVLKRLEEMGKRWRMGQKPTEYDRVYEAPMMLLIDCDGITESHNLDFQEAEKWLEENPKYKKGYLFQIKPNIADFQQEHPGIVGEMIDKAGKLVTLEKITDKGYLRFKESYYNWLEKWVNPIKEVKRTAKPGEFVKIVNACQPIKHEYKNGDILKIVDANFDGDTRYGKESGQFLYDEEYVVLEGYEDCDQVKKFKHFVPHLKSTWSKDSYGIIGEDTPIKDAVGRALKVGDTVGLFKNGKCDYEENVIVKDNEMAFVMGCKCSCNKDGSIDGWKIIKKRSYEEIKDGETVDGIKYVKSDCHD